MKQLTKLRIASWGYFVFATCFVLMLVASPSVAGRELKTGQVVSLAMLTLASLTLGFWARLVSAGKAKLTKVLFAMAFSTGPVIGVTFGGLVFGLLLCIPFLPIASAWTAAAKAASGAPENDR